VQFTIEYLCPDLNAVRDPAILKVDGECWYDSDTKTFSQFATRGEEIRFSLPDGTHTKRNVIMAAAHIVIGHKDIDNIMRVALE
jgi:hypothetical protein